MSNTQTPVHPNIAAIVYGDGRDPAPVIAEVVRILRERQVAVAGVIQHNPNSCDMELEILPGGARIVISQDLGSEAAGCRLNSAALADAASNVQKAIGGSPALVVFNKFGSREASGSGLRAEMVDAASAGLPILTAVRDTLVTEWTDFLGGDSVLLACSVDDALAWWDGLSRE